MKNLFILTALTMGFFASPFHWAFEGENDVIEAKIDALLAQMTLEEKIAQLSGVGFETRPNDRLGIPILCMTDGPVGVRWGNTTALPAAVALASTWDTALIRQVGEMLGREAKAMGRNVLLGPCVNIHRFPVGGRNFESFGEDPYLAGQIAVPYIQGVQSQGVIACVKHFACNNQEWNRFRVSANVDERTLHEIYFPAFKAAVQSGGVGSVMSSYNKINGRWASENEYLLNEVLKKTWGFTGFVVSDWGATHSTVSSVVAGLDLEMPFGKHYNETTIKQALEKKEITPAMIDDKVRRLLRARLKTRMFDPVTPESQDILTSSEHRKIAYEAAVNGIVLLKNERGILPIDPKKNKKIAVIGPNAAFARVGGGGSSMVTPFHAISALAGLQARVGPEVKLDYVLGAVATGEVRIIESRFLNSGTGEPGLKAEYFKGIQPEGQPLFVRIDKEVNFHWYYDAPRRDMHGADDENYFSVRWTGRFTAPRTGEYRFQIQHNDGVRLRVGQALLIDKWEDKKASSIDMASIHLNAGQDYDIVLEYYNNSGVSEIKLGWEIPGEDLIQEAADLAKRSDMALVFVGTSDHFEGEGFDRESPVLENQDKLIESVVHANPNTVVVMISGTPSIIEAWADDVPAILQAWFPGQEGGLAIADILLGNRNPAGKLPCSFYRSIGDSPGFLDYQEEDLQITYGEGIFVGYRFLDKQQVDPRFPFGHGLSYSSFRYGTAKARKRRDHRVDIRFPLENRGKCPGAEVVQLYVRPVKTSVERPIKELKAFQKVMLGPGETREISFSLNASSFMYYNVASHGWEVDKGSYEIWIGSSSRDIRQVVADIRIE